MVLDVVHDDERPESSRVLRCRSVVMYPGDGDSRVRGDVSHCCHFVKDLLVRKRDDALHGQFENCSEGVTAV